MVMLQQCWPGSALAGASRWVLAWQMWTAGASPLSSELGSLCRVSCPWLLLCCTMLPRGLAVGFGAFLGGAGADFWVVVMAVESCLCMVWPWGRVGSWHPPEHSRGLLPRPVAQHWWLCESWLQRGSLVLAGGWACCARCARLCPIGLIGAFGLAVWEPHELGVLLPGASTLLAAAISLCRSRAGSQCMAGLSGVLTGVPSTCAARQVHPALMQT